MDEPSPKQKSFAIPKRLVWEAWRQVRANKGAPGVDGQDLGAFEADLKNNLFKVWNRMSSGSWFPPPLRAVQIPKPHESGYRMLGVPTVADRVAQTVVAMVLEPLVEPRFVADSYGYRPGVSAHQALEACRRRCWKNDWVIDLDVQKFFDEVPWDLVLKAVDTVCPERWVLLYVRRWLAAPAQHPDGTLEERTKGTPQGSAISPVLANLFMHYAFDTWMLREFPACPFERYADDGVVHCTTHRQAKMVLDRIAARMNEPGHRGAGGSPAIPVYTGSYMKIVKVRRVGNSNVVSIPREFESAGYTPGSSVLVEDLGGGELRILPTDRVRERVRGIADRIVGEHPKAMEILANHDPDADDAHA